MKDVIATVFFSGKVDPQRGRKHVGGFSYIERWYNCVKKLGINAIIFHDNLSDEVASTYATDKIKFIEEDEFNRQKLCAADYRWVLYSKYFSKNKFDRIFVTDCNDVIVRNNPFSIVEPDKIYIGVEHGDKKKGLNDIIKNSWWCRGVYSYAYPDFPYWERKVLNCGIVGGEYDMFMGQVSRMSSEIIRIDPDPKECAKRRIPFTVDMAVLSFVGYTNFDGKIVSGAPLHSRYKLYEEKRDDVCLIHK
jgi:hypothetical protein